MAPDIGIEFEKWVDFKVAEAIRQQPGDFSGLVEALPGVYPAEVLASLRRLASAPKVLGIEHALIESASRTPEAIPSPSACTKLLPPHPLDYEWRFSRMAVDILAALCNRGDCHAGPIALVATPTLAALSTPPFLARTVSYFGADTEALRAICTPGWLSGLKSVNLLLCQAEEPRFSMVIMDPPWYEEYVRRFLWFGGMITTTGGVLLVAMPPDGTRPGTVEESARTLEWCEALGFELEKVDYSLLPYEMPPFERNALKAMSINNVRTTWRKADLWQLRKVRAAMPPWPGDVARSIWWEHTVGRVRIRIDTQATPRGDDPRLRPLVERDVLPTVSRRDRRRNDACIWTTGNRIFGCNAPQRLAGLLIAERDKAALLNGVEREALRQINALIARESGELV